MLAITSILMANPVMIHAVSFASEGPPHDEGLPLADKVLKEWGDLCLMGGADSFAGYTPRRIIEDNPADAWSVRNWGDEYSMGEQNRGYHKIGLGAWRAVIFNKAMKSANEGDIVVVHCSNFKNYPCMRQFATRMKDYVEAVMSFTDLYSPPHDHMGMWCPNEILNLISDPLLKDIVAFAPMGRCRLIIAKVNSTTRGFAELFEKTIKDDPSLLSSIGKTGYPGSGFHHHTAEQTVFNVLAFREGFFPRDWQQSWMMPLRQAGITPGSGIVEVIKYGAPHLHAKEEKWHSLMRKASELYDGGNLSEGDAETMKAWGMFPLRSEPLYHASRWYRLHGKNGEAYKFYQEGVQLPFSTGGSCCNPGAWEWAIELSIMSYYVVGKRDFKRTLELADQALKRHVSDEQVENMLTNLAFYTDPLPFPKTDLQVPKIEGHHNSTPCIFTKSDGSLVTLVRHVDYLINSTRLHDYTLPGYGYLSSLSSFRIGDGPWSNLTVVDDILVRNPRSFYKGVEDVRLFQDPSTGELRGIGTAYEYCDDFKGVITLLSVDLEKATMTPMRLIPRLQECEKNHVPILGTDLVVHSWSPKISIYNLHSSVVVYEQAELPLIFKRMRGSTAGVPYPTASSPESYWFITHSKTSDGPWIYYSYVTVLCAKTFRLLAYTPPFFFEKAQIEFTCGFSFLDSSLIVGYSTMDHSSKTVKIPIDWVKERLITASC